MYKGGMRLAEAERRGSRLSRSELIPRHFVSDSCLHTTCPRTNSQNTSFDFLLSAKVSRIFPFLCTKHSFEPIIPRLTVRIVSIERIFEIFRTFINYKGNMNYERTVVSPVNH